jgi:hypothetical protein
MLKTGDGSSRSSGPSAEALHGACAPSICLDGCRPRVSCCSHGSCTHGRGEISQGLSGEPRSFWRVRWEDSPWLQSNIDLSRDNNVTQT